MRNSKRWAGLIGLGLGFCLVGLQTGCQSFTKRETSWGSAKEMWGTIGKKSDEIEYVEPHQMAVIWSDSTMVGSDGQQTRGFAGRVYFNDKKNKPARVEGELAVYAYDDSDTPSKTKADRVYKFNQEDLQKHYSPSGIGPSYSFWIPWDQVGGERKSIALVPVFKTKSGKVVSGDQSLNILPGKATEKDEAAQRVPYYVAGYSPAVISGQNSYRPGMNSGLASGASVQQVAHYEPSVADPTAKARTTTIDVPRTMAARLQGHAIAPASVGGDLPSSTTTGGVSITYGPAENMWSNQAVAGNAPMGSGGDLTAENPGPLNSHPAVSSANPSSTPKSAAAATSPESGGRQVFGKPGAFR